MSDSDAGFLAPTIGGLVGVIVILMIALGTSPTYADGFCKARGGIVISDDYCDVEGKVVKVER